MHLISMRQENADEKEIKKRKERGTKVNKFFRRSPHRICHYSGDCRGGKQTSIRTGIDRLGIVGSVDIFQRQGNATRIKIRIVWAQSQTSSTSKLLGRTISFLASLLEVLRTQPDEQMDKQRLSSAWDDVEEVPPTAVGCPMPNAFGNGDGSGHNTFIFHRRLLIDCQATVATISFFPPSSLAARPGVEQLCNYPPHPFTLYRID